MATPDVGTLRRGRSAIGLSLIALVVGCNDHVTGKAGAGGSSAPFLADLSLLRSSAGLNEGGGATSVGFSVEVADPDADLAKLVVTVLDASDAEVGRFAYAVQNPPGVTGGLLAGDTAVPTTALGTYAVQLQAFDSGGRGSNVLEATFSVVPGNPLPSITSLDPSSAQAGSASFTLTVTGSDFLPSSSVLWDGYFLSTTYLDGSTLLASVPANDLYYTGMASITVLNPSPGGGVSSPATFAVTAPPAPVIATISPSSVTAGGPWFTLTVTGSGFAASSYVTWNGSSLATTFVDGSTLTATVPSYDTYYSGTAQITVYTSGAAASNAKTFTIDPQPPNPVPVLTGISPTSAYAGTSSVTVTLTGSGFVASSSAYWGGYSSLSTTFVDSSTLQATIPSYDLSGIGTGQISVSNPSPGGGTSGALKFSVTKPPQDGVTAVALQANDLVWDPYQRKIYAAVPSTSPVNPNTVTVVDPFTGQIEGSQFAGSEPRVLAVSDDGQFLYAGLGSASFVNRFALPALAQDLAIPLGRDPTLGAYSARDVQVAPGFPRTVAVSLGVGATPSVQGGVAIFDDATPRANRAASASNLFDSLQWGADASVLYAANNELSSFDLYTLAVDGSGATLTNDYRNAFSIFSQRIHFDPGTGFVYGDDARAIDPDSGLLVGTFIPNTYSWASSAMIPDSTLGTAFFVRPDPSGSSSFLVLRSFDIVHYVAAQSTTLAYVSGTPVHLIRWWTDGLAFLAGNQIVLLRGSLVLPPSSTANPAPSVAALSPATAAAGGGNFRLTVTGSGFVPGSIVRWNGSDRTTRYASATSLVAFIPASDVVAAGSAQVTVRNPLPGGGVSDASTFDVTP